MNSKRIFITGATGFLGNALVKRLATDERYFVTAALRCQEIEFPNGVKSVKVGNLEESCDLSQELHGSDVVIHTAARVHIMHDIASDPIVEYRKVNVQGTLNLARQAAAIGVKRFIFVSSIKVNGGSTLLGHPYYPDDKPSPVDPYGISKCEAEQRLYHLSNETGMEIVIIRPCLVYGPGVKANFLRMMKWLDRGVPLPLGSIANKRSLVALDNLVDLIVACIEHSSAANQIFLAADGEDLSTTELFQRIGAALGKTSRLIPVPTWLLSLVMKLLGKGNLSQRLCSSLQADISKNHDLLGWQPPVSVDVGLKKAAESFLAGKY